MTIEVFQDIVRDEVARSVPEAKCVTFEPHGLGYFSKVRFADTQRTWCLGVDADEIAKIKPEEEPRIREQLRVSLERLKEKHLNRKDGTRT